MRRLLALIAVAAALLCVPPAQAAFEPGDVVTYSAGGAARTGVVMVKAGAKDLYLVSRDGSESTQYVLPGSRLTPRDRDGDGVPDDRDSCLTQAGAAPSGCPPPPDEDGDSVADSADSCSTLPGGAPDGCPAPTAAFGFSPTSPQVGQDVRFDAPASGCHSSPCTYTWDDVMGGVLPLGEGQLLTHRFTEAGTRSVRLTVRDVHGRVGAITRSVTVSAAPAPSPPADAPTLRQVDGGPGYYGQFSNPLPTDLFPLSVWGSYDHSPENIQVDGSRGLNGYSWFADADQAGRLANAGTAGMWAIVDKTADGGAAGSATVARLTDDELDMRCGPHAHCYQQLEDLIRSLPVDGRAVYANYGKGVLLWETEAEAARFINGTTSFGRYQDIVSVDMYWHTDQSHLANQNGGKCSPDAPQCVAWHGYPWLPEGERPLTVAETQRSANYGYQVDWVRHLDGLDGRRQPIWNFVEVGCPFSECGSLWDPIKPAEVRASVWHSIIAGARGIVYFQHTFNGPAGCVTHHVLRDNLSCYSQVRQTVTSVNAQVRDLAPVLNAPFVDGLVESAQGVRVMAKRHGGQFYLFAGRRENGGPSQNTISLPCVGNATATVLGESRTLPVTSGQLTDSFADGNAIHIYRIDGGSSCGLT